VLASGDRVQNTYYHRPWPQVLPRSQENRSPRLIVGTQVGHLKIGLSHTIQEDDATRAARSYASGPQARERRWNRGTFAGPPAEQRLGSVLRHDQD
jgi:hypothetical protein